LDYFEALSRRALERALENEEKLGIIVVPADKTSAISGVVSDVSLGEQDCSIKDENLFFIANLIACSTCFGHHYAHHQELKSITQWLLPVVFRAVVFK